MFISVSTCFQFRHLSIYLSIYLRGIIYVCVRMCVNLHEREKEREKERETKFELFGRRKASDICGKVKEEGQEDWISDEECVSGNGLTRCFSSMEPFPWKPSSQLGTAGLSSREETNRYKGPLRNPNDCQVGSR